MPCIHSHRRPRRPRSSFAIAALIIGLLTCVVGCGRHGQATPAPATSATTPAHEPAPGSPDTSGTPGTPAAQSPRDAADSAPAKPPVDQVGNPPKPAPIDRFSRDLFFNLVAQWGITEAPASPDAPGSSDVPSSPGSPITNPLAVKAPD